MSQLIRSLKVVTTVPHLIPSPSISAAITPSNMEPKPVNPVDATDAVAPQCSQVRASSTSSIELLVSTRRGHCCPLTPDTTSASTTDASMSQPSKHVINAITTRINLVC
ncbi:hypothetical protein ACFX1T_020251 [Malus domestica]